MLVKCTVPFPYFTVKSQESPETRRARLRHWLLCARLLRLGKRRRGESMPSLRGLATLRSAFHSTPPSTGGGLHRMGSIREVERGLVSLTTNPRAIHIPHHHVVAR